MRLQSYRDGKPLKLPDAGRFVVGRSKECDFQIDEQAVSRKHAAFFSEGKSLFVEDLGSRAGTFMNGVRIAERRQLAVGDLVRIGTCEFLAKDEDAQSLSEERPSHEQVNGASAKAMFAQAFENATVLCTDEMMAFKTRIHNMVLARLNANGNGASIAANKELAGQATRCLDEVLLEISHELPDTISRDVLRQALLDELLDLGPISPMLRMNEVSEIMVNGPNRIFVEYCGKLYETGVRFSDGQHLLQIIQRIVEPLGRHVDDASPMVDARLEDGSRVNAIVPPLALDGASLTIRKFAEKKLTTDDLIKFGSMTKDMALFLEEAVKSRQNILVSGGTGSGKTTLLNILSQFIPEGERLVTVEDSAELKLSHRNIVRLEARPANVEGKGRVTIRDLVINCLRMRPDRIIVGECRGAEALDMLQAMNTGHDGSLTTAHANNPRDALSRLENMVMMAGYDLPSSAIREQIASAIDIIVQQTRLGDGSRKIMKIVEVTGRENDVIQIQDIFEFKQTGFDSSGNVQGEYHATGNIPYFIEEQRSRGVLSLDMSVFVPKV